MVLLTRTFCVQIWNIPGLIIFVFSLLLTWSLSLDCVARGLAKCLLCGSMTSEISGLPVVRGGNIRKMIGSLDAPRG